ncbi:uncharacterized protein LOC131317267 [Rhododendron vialii]|uniref:uncharacterized protein LOC131317267 n=1 Tax=Rhododendron vialii TaxID=182163 RepID=UPI00265FCDDF|nr:uncharacterized protein LOC131317267 [Rhododendron vialii]
METDKPLFPNLPHFHDEKNTEEQRERDHQFSPTASDRHHHHEEVVWDSIRYLLVIWCVRNDVLFSSKLLDVDFDNSFGMIARTVYQVIQVFYFISREFYVLFLLVTATSDVNSPISGEVVEVNSKLTESPDLEKLTIEGMKMVAEYRARKKKNDERVILAKKFLSPKVKATQRF